MKIERIQLKKPKKYYCRNCGAEILESDNAEYEGLCFDCYNTDIEEEEDAILFL